MKSKEIHPPSLMQANLLKVNGCQLVLEGRMLSGTLQYDSYFLPKRIEAYPRKLRVHEQTSLQKFGPMSWTGGLRVGACPRV